MARFFGLLRELVAAQRARAVRAAGLGLLSERASAACVLQQWHLAAARDLERSDRQGLEEAQRAGERAALLRHWAAWRHQAADERTQRSHSELAEGQRSRRATLSAFLCWRRAWHGASVESYSADSAQNSLRVLKDSRACRACFDDSFAPEMASFFDSNLMGAHSHLAGALAHLRTCSASVERRHLRGLSLKPSKSRGLAVNASNLAVTTYVHGAVQVARLTTAAVHKKVLERYGVGMTQYHALPWKFRLGGSRQPSSDVKRVGAATLESILKHSKVTAAYQRFRSEKCLRNLPVGSPEFQLEGRIKGWWAAAPDEDATLYGGHAAAMPDTVADVLDDLTTEKIEAARPQMGDHRIGLVSALDRWLPAASRGVGNVYKLLKRWHISRPMLPATIPVSLNGVANHYVLAGAFGKGGTMFFLRLGRVEGLVDAFKPMAVVERGFAQVASMTGQMAIRSCRMRCGLGLAAVVAGMPIKFNIYNAEKFDHRRGLAILTVGTAQEEDAPLNAKPGGDARAVKPKDGELALPFGLRAERGGGSTCDAPADVVGDDVAKLAMVAEAKTDKGGAPAVADPVAEEERRERGDRVDNGGESDLDFEGFSRRKFFKYKTGNPMPQRGAVGKLQTDEKFRETLRGQRRSRARGDAKRSRLEDGNQSTEAFRGRNDAQLMPWLRENYSDVEVVQDRRGALGVKEQNLPQGAWHKHREGASEATPFNLVPKFEDGANDIAASGRGNQASGAPSSTGAVLEFIPPAAPKPRARKGQPRSRNTEKVLGACRDLRSMTVDKFDNAEMWEEGATNMAHDFLGEPERLKFIPALFGDARNDPAASIGRALNAAQKHMVQKLSPKLMSNAFVAAGVAAISKMEFPGPGELGIDSHAISAARSILRFAMFSDDDSMNCGLLPEARRDKVRHRVALGPAENTSTASNGHSQKTQGVLVDSGAPDATERYFSGPVVPVVLGMKSDVSSRLRNFSSMKREPAHLGVTCWGAVGDIVALGNALQSVASRFKAVWAELKDSEMPGDNRDDTLLLVGHLINAGTSANILEAAQLLTIMGSDTAPQAATGDAFAPRVIEALLGCPPPGGCGQDAGSEAAASILLRAWLLLFLHDNLEGALDRDRSGATAAPATPRSASIEKAATEACKSALNVRESFDHGVTQLAAQLKILSPPKCGEILNAAETRDNVVAVLARLPKKEPAGLAGIIGAAADCHQLPQTSAHSNELDMMEVSLKMNKARRGPAAANGDWAARPWFEKVKNKEVEERMAQCGRMGQTAKSTYLVASAAYQLMLKFDAGPQRAATAQVMIDECKGAAGLEGDVRIIFAAAAIGHVFAQRPRPKTRRTDLQKTGAYFIAQGGHPHRGPREAHVRQRTSESPGVRYSSPRALDGGGGRPPGRAAAQDPPGVRECCADGAPLRSSGPRRRATDAQRTDSLAFSLSTVVTGLATAACKVLGGSPRQVARERGHQGCRAAASGARAASALGRWARAWAAATRGREARRAQVALPFACPLPAAIFSKRGVLVNVPSARDVVEPAVRAVAGRWFMWREVKRILALKAERARLELGLRRGASAARRWRGLRGARALCRQSTERSLARWAVGLWQLVLSQTRADRRAKVEQGHQIGCQFALRRTFGEWWQRVAGISDLRRRLAIFREALAPVVRWRLRGQQLLALRELGAWASECRRADDACLLQECLQGWVAHCCQKLHKTSVDLLCRRYRETHSMGRAFRGWAARCARARGLAQGVLRWAAGVATDRVLASLCAWRRIAVRRRGLRALSATVLVQRRSSVLAMWRCTLVRQLAIRGTLAHKELELRRSWLRLWRKCAAAVSARRRREAAQALLVQLSRQRSWIDRWVEARSRQRMLSVAVNWDVTGRDVLRLAIMAWSGTMGLYERGRRAAEAVAQRRRGRHACGWASLWRAATARLWTSGRLALSAWRASHLQAVEERRQQAWMVRLVLLTSVAQVARIQRGRTRRADHAACWQRVRLGLLRGCWAHRCAELRVVDHGPRARPADRERESVEELCGASRRRGALGAWRESWLLQRAQNFMRYRPHLYGTQQAQQALQAWAQHASKQQRDRAAAANVAQLCAEARLSHFLERWVGAYEYEASTFYAAQILQKSWLSRVVLSWQRVCAFQKRFSAHVSEVCTLRDTKLQQRVISNWIERIQRHRLIAAVWLERRQLWSSALLRAWRGEAARLRSLREAVRRLRTEARLARGRRAAVLMQVRGAAGLQRMCFAALARWARESAALRTRCGDLERLVERGRQGRRLCAWMASTRAVARCLEAQAAALRVWAAAAVRQASAKAQLQSLASSREGLRLLAATAAWCAWARRARHAAVAARAVQERAAAWHRGRCAREWLALAEALRHRRALVVGHRVRWRPHHLWGRFAAWALAARCVRRARAAHADSLALCLRLWRVRAATASAGRRRGQAALRSLAEHLAAPVARAWLAQQRRRVAARRLARILDREPEWVDDEEWFYHAASDEGLAAMFARFAHAFDQQRPTDATAARKLAADEGAFESLVSLIWERQQASVALGRLKGYPQPWVLGSWPRESLPLLAPSSPYYLQAELRLAVMVSQRTRPAPATAWRRRSRSAC
ncbi:unnamed protein product [Prorocentrum cordatum]|uniref:Uncharacterized protein n=1 Tax=Prorocentrum cordatum TaxID=2364126 RepID=A0ABN9VLF6_9DINO|nr:unnamed protein product [Polarella glacialis]